MARLAIDGGQPHRKQPFPKRAPFGDEEIELVAKAIRSQNLFGLGGPMVGEFEKRFAALYGAKYYVASSSGTAALHIAIGTVNPEPGDEIITAPITDAGTVVPILYQNAIPIFADVANDYNMDPDDVEAKITDRTRAILVVHLFGNPCDMDRMTDIAKRHDLPLIEDCSQAHMTEYKGKLLGTFGDFGGLSLQQSKHMTTGDGGVTITNDERWSHRMMLFSDKGWSRKPTWGARTYEFLAPNYRMTELQGAVGIAQTKKVAEVVRKRNELGDLLSQSISDLPDVEAAPVVEGGKHTYWFYPLRITEGSVEEFAKALEAEGVACWPNYSGEPIYICMDALARKETYGRSHYPFDGTHTCRQIDYTHGLCPKAEAALKEIIVLTIHEGMSREDALDVAGAVRKVAEGLRAKRNV